MIEGVLLLIVVIVIAYFSGVFKGAPFVPTMDPIVQEMIRLAEIKSGDKLVDLGSGDGRILIAAAKVGAEAHGFEINPFLVWWSRYKISKAGLSNKAFVYTKSFWPQDLSEYKIVTVFGITKIMPELEKKLLKELKPGSVVMSNIFKFPNWQSEKHGSLYKYKKD